MPFVPFGPVALSPAAVLGTQPWWTLPNELGMLAANVDPVDSSGTLAMTAGSVYLLKIPIRSALTATNILLILTTAGSGASTGSFVGLYSSAGTLLSGSADQAGPFTGSLGVITCPLTAPQALTAGTFVWAAVLSNLATTQPTLARSQASGTNALLTAAGFRFAINGTALSALPGSVTPGSNAGSAGGNFFAGIS